MSALPPKSLSSDCVVVGGGPAGLLAATYLARFRRRVVVVDAGNSRALKIPCINNCPGFPDGISGRTLVAKLRDQAVRYDAEFINKPVENIERTDNEFLVRCGPLMLTAPRLLLATGAIDRAPDLPDIDRNIERRALCFCPVCDGYEARDKKIGVIGKGDHVLQEAIFLKAYSPLVTILMNEPAYASAQLRAVAKEAGIAVCDNVKHIISGSAGYEVVDYDGSKIPFDVIYPALGCDVRSGLAAGLGVLCDEDGHIRVGAHQQTNVESVYAAGDVVHSLNQIAVAFGQAATAATAIHNSLSAGDVRRVSDAG